MNIANGVHSGANMRIILTVLTPVGVAVIAAVAGPNRRASGE